MELGPEGRADRCLQLTFLEERSNADRIGPQSRSTRKEQLKAVASSGYRTVRFKTHLQALERGRLASEEVLADPGGGPFVEPTAWPS